MAIVTKNFTINDYIEALSSKSSVPGGGGACGVVAALGASLGSMVCNLTIGKERYADYEEEIKELLYNCTKLTQRFLECADEDAKCFEPLSKAYGLPHKTDEEKAYRDKVLEENLIKAAMAPIDTMLIIADILNILDRLADIGSILAISDVGVGAELAIAASDGAALNVFINTKLMKDRAAAEELNNKTRDLIDANHKLGRRAYNKVYKLLDPNGPIPVVDDKK